MTYAVRESTEDDLDDVARLLDAAMLEFDRERLVARIDSGAVLAAVDRREKVVGVCVLDVPDDDCLSDDGGSEIPTDDHGSSDAPTGDHAASGDDGPTEIESIAVHQSRRGRGIGRALVEAATTRSDGALVARFHEQVRPFYDALGFEVREHASETDSGSDDDRLYGVLA